jgi:hypothetical protein
MTDEFRTLFDGHTLDGWRAIPRVYGKWNPGGPAVTELMAQYGIETPADPESYPATWAVEDGAIVGRQAKMGYGGYLLSEETFGDFELELEMRPDWPADTGVMVRRQRDSWEGFQILVDHRPSGGIGGFYGNGLAGFSAVPFAVDAVLDSEGRPMGLRADDPVTSAEPVTPDKIARLCYAAKVEDFLDVWRWGDWNALRVRCVGGALPVITAWVNGLRIGEVDTATLQSPGYDAAAVAALLGERGHIAFEVHDHDSHFGQARGGPGAACRWRNIRIREV